EQKGNVPSNNEISSEEISIINGTSVDFYALYLSANTSGNLGENIINGSTFGEGEELILPYANLDTSQSLNLIVEDESGKRYIIEDFPISNGAVIEIRLNGNTLEAFVQ
ncbi:MAG: hypothetical protein LUD03_01780, partial [Firmicutes bacterium]|nr:hypothetical protein [Bacillota bacterium]